MSRLRLAGTFASLALVATALALAVFGGDSSGTDEAAAGNAPHFVSSDELDRLEDAYGHPLYWAGPRPPYSLELRQETDGSVYLRYLPPGAEPGTSPAGFLTVGTYPVPEAETALRRAAAAVGQRVRRLPDGAVVFKNPNSEGSVYLAYPESDLQLEVFDPIPGRALRLIRSGAIRPVGE